jgi:hypothetical protein
VRSACGVFQVCGVSSSALAAGHNH